MLSMSSWQPPQAAEEAKQSSSALERECCVLWGLCVCLPVVVQQWAVISSWFKGGDSHISSIKHVCFFKVHWKVNVSLPLILDTARLLHKSDIKELFLCIPDSKTVGSRFSFLGNTCTSCALRSQCEYFRCSVYFILKISFLLFRSYALAIFSLLDDILIYWHMLLQLSSKRCGF